MSIKNRLLRLEQLIADEIEEMPDGLTDEERKRFEILSPINKEKSLDEGIAYLQSPEFKEYRRLLVKAVQAGDEYRRKHFGRHAYYGIAEAINAGRERARQRVLQNAAKGDVE